MKFNEALEKGEEKAYYIECLLNWTICKCINFKIKILRYFKIFKNVPKVMKQNTYSSPIS